MWWLIIPAVFLAFLAIILIRAALFKPRPQEKPPVTEAVFDEAQALEHFREMIRCKTVSNRDKSQEDQGEFEKFRQLLKEKYPKVHESCTLRRVGETGLLYHLKGESSQAPSVFMAHYDVVAANEADWEKPPFAAELENGVLWGRGTLDTKITLLGVMESAEVLLSQGFRPQNDIYFSFAGDEEITGPSAPAIVDELEKMGVKPALVVDEGGAVVEDVFPGVSGPCALIGTGEKGILDLELSIKSGGGHASAPPPHTPVGLLSQACVRVENKPFKTYMAPPVAEMFDTLGRHSTFAMRLVFANLWVFRPVLNALCTKKGGEMNALMRTTVAFTQMEGSKGTNVLSPEARMVANLRLAGSETPESAMAYIAKVSGNPDIRLRQIYGMKPSKFSPTQGPGWEKLKSAVAQTWPEALISPYLMVACSDSRHFCRISDYVYRFSAMALTGEERASIHGNNERIPVSKMKSTIAFYMRLMRQC